MGLHRRQCVYATALIATFGCGGTASTRSGHDGPASTGGAFGSAGSSGNAHTSSSAGAPANGSNGGGGSVGATGGSSAIPTAGHTSAGGGPGTGPRACRLPTAADLALTNPQTKSEVLFNDVLAEQLERLYEGIGQYASGETPVFRGQLHAREDRTVVGGQLLTIDTTRAIASLAYEDGLDSMPSAGLALDALDPDTQQAVRVLQSHGSSGVHTFMGFISPFFSLGGSGAPVSCSNCPLDLAGVKNDVSFDLTVYSHYLDSDSTPARIDAQGQFSRVSADALTLDDILTVNSRSSRSLFLRATPRMAGDYAVFDMKSSVGEGKDANGCSLITYYAIEWFVRTSCLLDYGARNLVIDTHPPNCSNDG